MKKYLFIVLLVGVCFGQKEKIHIEILRYDSNNNRFISNNASQPHIKVSDFFSVLSKNSTMFEGDSLKLNKVPIYTYRYNKIQDEYHLLKSKYDSGTESEDGLGRYTLENKYLINDKNLWYAASIITFVLPTYQWFREEQKQNEIDREIEKYGIYKGNDKANPELWADIAILSIIPGITIGITGFIGSKIKIGEERVFIKHTMIKERILLDVLSEDEIKLLILAYNSLDDMQIKASQ